MSLEYEIEVQRLASNIFHLHGQLALAKAIIQQKELTIAQQNKLIQQQAFSAQILTQTVQKNQTKQEDKEPLIGDIVSVKKYELFKLLELDLPKIVRKLKDMVRKQN